MNLEKNDSTHISEDQGQLLVRLARQTIEKKLGCSQNVQRVNELEEALLDDMFKVKCGTFVTLKISQNLRGCIGSIDGYSPLAQGVRENAINAAFRDPRFRPLSLEELDQVKIEVSILTRPEPLAYTDAQDLLTKLKPKVDGVIIRKKAASATFLPQVWEQLPLPKSFLSNLCLKAGLRADEWQQGQLEVSTYQVQYFEES